MNANQKSFFTNLILGIACSGIVLWRSNELGGFDTIIPTLRGINFSYADLVVLFVIAAAHSSAPMYPVVLSTAATEVQKLEKGSKSILKFYQHLSNFGIVASLIAMGVILVLNTIVFMTFKVNISILYLVFLFQVLGSVFYLNQIKAGLT